MNSVFVLPSVEFIRHLVDNGGPCQEEYAQLDAWFRCCHLQASAGQLTEADIEQLLAAFGDAMGVDSMQGRSVAKPHGYAGDFETIDKIYLRHVSPDPKLARWDEWFQQHYAPQAVRNRKSYFHQLLDNLRVVIGSPRILKIGIGPGRSMFEWLSHNPDAAVTFDCVDIDAAAIAYSRELNQPFLDRIRLIRKNCLRYRPDGQYDLIWVAGVFDYFDAPTFCLMVKRLLSAVAPDGELVIGNFSDANPSRPCMEFAGAWVLHHRGPLQLIHLAERCGIPRRCITIKSEPLGVNLFLHITQPKIS